MVAGVAALTTSSLNFPSSLETCHSRFVVCELKNKPQVTRRSETASQVLNDLEASKYRDLEARIMTTTIGLTCPAALDLLPQGL